MVWCMWFYEETSKVPSSKIWLAIIVPNCSVWGFTEITKAFTLQENPPDQNIVPLVMEEMFLSPENLHWAWTCCTFRTELQQIKGLDRKVTLLFQKSTISPVLSLGSERKKIYGSTDQTVKTAKCLLYWLRSLNLLIKQLNKQESLFANSFRRDNVSSRQKWAIGIQEQRAPCRFIKYNLTASDIKRISLYLCRHKHNLALQWS